MKKKFIVISVLLLLIVSIVGLTACDFSGLGGLFDKNGTENNQNGKGDSIQSGNDQTKPSEKDEDDTNPIIVNSVQGKTYIFETASLDFVKIWYPNGAEIDDNTYDEYFMPTNSEMQEYINLVANDYKRVRLSFKEDNILNIVYPDSRGTQTFTYSQNGEGITIQGLDEFTTVEVVNRSSLEFETILYADEEVPVLVMLTLSFEFLW